MGVRLNKVLTELNIGLQTAIDYLKNKKSLGDIKDDANVNTKISDEQYDALVKEFKGDKDVKTQAGMIFPKKKDKPKAKPEPVVEMVREEPRQTFTPLGKIDLGQVGKPAVKEKEEPKVEEPVEAPKSEPVEVKPEPKPEPQPEPAPEPKEEPQPEPEVEVTPEAEEPEPEVEDEVEEEEAPAEDKNIFTLKSEEKMAPKVNVLGKIDLESLNQSTRPKKKSKEERKREREEKQAQQHNVMNGGGERKNSRYALFDENMDVVFIKSSDDNNNTATRIFTMTEISLDQYNELLQKDSPYATKKDVNELKEALINVEQLIRELRPTKANGPAANGAISANAATAASNKQHAGRNANSQPT